MRDITARRADPLLETLKATFPVFRECRPLAIGIHKAILARMPDVKPDAVKAILKAHTGATRYLKAVSLGKERFDLDGQPAGEVTAEHRQQARDILKERFRKHDERRRAEHQEQERQVKLAQLVRKFAK